MAEDNGKRLRWRDRDPESEGETRDDGAVRQHGVDVDRLARLHMASNVPVEQSRMGQRSGETAEVMQAAVRNRIAAIEAEFHPENPRLAHFKTQFEDAKPEAKNGHTWEEVVAAMKKGGQFNSVDEFLAATGKLENAKIYFIQGNELLIGEGNPEVPRETLGMNYYKAEAYCRERGLDMLTKEEWERLQGVYSETEQQYITWLKTDQADLDSGLALRAYRGLVDHGVAGGGGHDCCVRGVLRVNLAFGRTLAE